jgi:DNA-directed RNA polymerase specialized sigma24 family protein
MDRIFRDNMAELYWLAFLLTGDRERSIQAFTGALNSETPAPALQKFMLSWARRLVIVAALGTIRRQLRESALRTLPATKGDVAELARLASADLGRLTKQELEEALLEMDAFSRCVVVLAILEKLPVKEVADLLGADEGAVKAAQARGVTEMTWRLAGVMRPESQRFFSLGQAAMAAFG